MAALSPVEHVSYHRILTHPHKENSMVLFIQRSLKAISAALAAGVAGYGTAVADGTVAGDEWVSLLIAALGAGLLVWFVPYKQAAAPQ